MSNSNLTPEDVKDSAEDLIKNGQFCAFSGLLYRISEQSELLAAISPEAVQQTAIGLIESGDGLCRFGHELLPVIKDQPELLAVIPEAISQGAARLIEKGKFSQFTTLVSIVKDPPELLAAALPKHDIFHIPTIEKTHDYNITLAFNREDGKMKFFAGCLSKDDLLSLKDHWSKHDDDQRRDVALPLVWKSLKQIARGRSPAHVVGEVVEDREKLAAFAAKELRSAGYTVPAYKGSMG